jgi:aminopeptidase
MTLDSRAEELAKIVVDYSLDIQPDDVLLVRSEQAFKKFAEYIAFLAQKKGASVIFDHEDLQQVRDMVERNDADELSAESKRLCSLAEQATASVVVDAETNPYYLRGVDPKKIVDYKSIAKKPFLDRIVGNGREFKGIKWNLVAYPCRGEAEKAGMTLNEYANLLYNATNIDWRKTREEMKRTKDIFDNAKDVHIIVQPFTDLHLSLEGRGGDICDGRLNLPDGELYYGPVEDSANGKIYFPYTSVRDGNELRGIKLVYKDGEVISFSAEENQSFLEAMLNLPGVRRIGEFGIGCNHGIKRYIRNLLFDEKIGGTIHLALGESYKEPLNKGGGLNEAETHWDLVCDLRQIGSLPGGEIYVDGRLVQKHGLWVE